MAKITVQGADEDHALTSALLSLKRAGEFRGKHAERRTQPHVRKAARKLRSGEGRGQAAPCPNCALTANRSNFLISRPLEELSEGFAVYGRRSDDSPVAKPPPC